MTPALTALLGSLAGFTTFYIGAWFVGARRAAGRSDTPPEARPSRFPGPLQLVVGFVTNFFDTLGIGSFAPTTAVFKFLKMVPDRLVPGTLNVGHTLPAIAQAFIFTLAIGVDVTTLVLMIAAAVSGAWIGAGIVASWPKRWVQVGMGCALIVAASLFAWSNLGGGATTVGTLDLTGVKLALGLAGNFALGSLMTLGIGLYAPCMILVGLLGMNAKAAFPIMMGSCAFLMPVASAKFVQKQAYSFTPALGLALGGIPGVLIAAFLVKEMDITTVRWLVVGVVLIAAAMMLRSAAKGE
ncbi:MAG: sulfite exporter TauE/SafE family protein [Vicinamibacterales bacterium]